MCKDILCCLINKRMSEENSWYTSSIKCLLKNLFEECSNQNNLILGFSASSEDNFMFPNFDNLNKENAQYILEKFVKSFEDSKTEILKNYSNEKDILNVKKKEFLKVMDDIFNILKNNRPINNFENKTIYNDIKDIILEEIEKIEKMENNDINLKKEIKKIYKYISEFLEKNKKNIDKINIPDSKKQTLENLNKKILDIFSYSNISKKGFNTLKNKFSNFIFKYYGNILKDNNKNNFIKRLNTLNLKELKEIINDIYCSVDVKHIDSNLKPTSYTSLTYPILFIFNFEFDVCPKNGRTLIDSTLVDIIKIIKNKMNLYSCDKNYIFLQPILTENNINKNSILEIALISNKDNYQYLYSGAGVDWRFRDEIIENSIVSELMKKIPDIYANRLLNIYKKIIEDKNIDTKNLDVDKFLKEAKNFNLYKYSNEPNNIDKNINEDEKKDFNQKLFNKIKEQYLENNKSIYKCTVNNIIYTLIGFQIDFIVERFAKNLKQRYQELIKKILIESKIPYNETDYELKDGDNGLLSLQGDIPQEDYDFNLKLLLNDALFNKKNYINKILKNDEKEKIIINEAVKNTIEEFNKMTELTFKKELKNHFEKNKNNIKKYIEQKNLSDDEKNDNYNKIQNFINNTKKENFNYKDFLINWDIFINSINIEYQKFQ